MLLTLAVAALAFLQGAKITFAFENPQLQPAAYTLEINEDGTGHFRSTPGPASSGVDTVADIIAPGPLDREIQIDEPLRSSLFSAARTHKFFAIACEPEHSKVAFTGKKTFSYSGPDGQGSCSYNYSQNQALNQLAEQMIAVANTLEIGRRLIIEHEHSRLALDGELELLQQAVKNGRALEIENIAPILQSIANDESVMLRARKRAAGLVTTGSSKS